MDSPFRKVTDDFYTSPQITPADVAQAAALGVRLIINNRPEGEEPGQPTGSEIAAAAADAGLEYRALPIAGRPSDAQAQAMRAILEEAKGPVLAYCRSGTRSIAAWALGQAGAGAADRQALLTLARQAGYDLSMLLQASG